MSEKHSYINPSEKLDLSHLEATVTKGKKYYNEQGWEISAPISDRECIYKCLQNCEDLAGLDKLQVGRLMKEFAVERTDEQIKSEYPPL
tara:strand:- start:666 stop:932 length:267 start_codon:yes stop_codon:yes gene_type:complete